MRKLYYYDNVHQRRRKQQQQLVDCNNREYCGDSNKKSRRYKEIGAVLSKYAATKNDRRDENFYLHSHSDHNEQPQQQPLNQLTKCAKMTEENGMIKHGNLNGVGIARSISQNLTNFSSFTSSPSTTTTPPSPTTTTTTASASSSTIGTSDSLANSISNSNNSVRANNESTANATSSPNGLNGGGGVVGDPSNGDCGDQKPTNNNNGNIGAYPNALGGRLQFFKGKQSESKLSSIVSLENEWHEPRNLISLVAPYNLHTHAMNSGACKGLLSISSSPKKLCSLDARRCRCHRRMQRNGTGRNWIFSISSTLFYSLMTDHRMHATIKAQCRCLIHTLAHSGRSVSLPLADVSISIQVKHIFCFALFFVLKVRTRGRRLLLCFK